MNQAEYLDFHRALLEEATKVTAAKNTDYSGEGSDAFKNFRGAESVGVPAAVGAFIRLTDKVARMARLLVAPAQVTSESFRDTVVDLVNYSVIVAALQEERTTKEGAEAYLQRMLGGQHMGLCAMCDKQVDLRKSHTCGEESR